MAKTTQKTSRSQPPDAAWPAGRVVNVHQAKTHLSRLLRAVRRGEEIVVATAGKPVARLVPYREAKPKRRLGVARGAFHAPAGAFAPLTEAEIALFEAEDEGMRRVALRD